MRTTTTMPNLPLLPELDALLDDDALCSRFVDAVYQAARKFVTGVRLRRDFAAEYVAALQHYMSLFAPCAWFDVLATESESGQAERKKYVLARRSARRRLDMLGARLPTSVHTKVTCFAILGGTCEQL
jgi:hypothetical protein